MKEERRAQCKVRGGRSLAYSSDRGRNLFGSLLQRERERKGNWGHGGKEEKKVLLPSSPRGGGRTQQESARGSVDKSPPGKACLIAENPAFTLKRGEGEQLWGEFA